MAELQYIQDTRKALSKLVTGFDQMADHISSRESSDKELSSRVAELTRLNRELEQRAVLAETRCDLLATKANAGERLELASTTLIAALDRLPLTMYDAAVIESAVKPAIALYGTYDWQAVMDAKHSLIGALKNNKES